MFYFVLFGVSLAALCRRNPLHLVRQLTFRAPLLLIFCFLLQLLLSILVNFGYQLPPLCLEIPFLGMVIGLFLNHAIRGSLLIATGASLNFLALVVHGGRMPVSTVAMHVAGLTSYTFFGVDSRHQAMGDSPFWWLGDWVPMLHHVFSPGDLLVGLGLIVLIFTYSSTPQFKETQS